MLTDEVASSLLDMYPITSDILKVVTKHVKQTEDVPSCILEEVPLMFVFRAGSSLDKFIPEFKRLSLPNYHLTEEGSYYYIIKDAKPEQKAMNLQSSLIPPLSVTAKFLPLTLHSDDSTELRQISSSNDPAAASKPHPVDSSVMNMEILSEIKEKKLRRQTLRDVNESESDNETEVKNVSKSRKPRTSHERDIPSYFKFGKEADEEHSVDLPLGHSSPKKKVLEKATEEADDAVIVTEAAESKDEENIKDVSLSPAVLNLASHGLDCDEINSSCDSSSPPTKLSPGVSRLRTTQGVMKNVPSGSKTTVYDTEDGMIHFIIYNIAVDIYPSIGSLLSI